MLNYLKRYVNEDIKFDKKTKLSILLLMVVIAGVFGFIYEFIFYYLNSGFKTFYYRGSNFLPWINIYAIGALFIYFLTYKKRKNPIKAFIFSTLICGILEYVAGYIMYTYFDGFRCWDYNTEILNFGNINGYICVRSVLFFGLSSLLLIYVIIPLLYFLASKINTKILFIMAIVLFSIFIFDELYNLIFARILDLDRASDIYKRLGFKYMKF